MSETPRVHTPDGLLVHDHERVGLVVSASEHNTKVSELNRALAAATAEVGGLKARLVISETAVDELTPLIVQLAQANERAEKAERERDVLAEETRRQYWALREGDNIVRHIRTLIFPGWTNLSDRDVNECLRAYEAKHGIDANYVSRLDSPGKGEGR